MYNGIGASNVASYPRGESISYHGQEAICFNICIICSKPRTLTGANGRTGKCEAIGMGIVKIGRKQL